jgi:hypothetical protein
MSKGAELQSARPFFVDIFIPVKAGSLRFFFVTDRKML